MTTPLTRRSLLQSAGSLAFASAGASLAAAQVPSTCKTCHGANFLPLRNRKPYVHVEGQAPPRPADAIPHRFCPDCQADRDPLELVEQQVARLKVAFDSHKKWERETGFRLTRVETRHITIHSQFPVSEGIKIGQACENLAAHLQGVTNSMELTPTQPDNYEQMCLADKRSYDHLREVLERLYTPNQRGEQWSTGRGLSAFDHYLMPFLYETPQTIKRRPLPHGVCFFAARRQLTMATNSRAPRWLIEGFAEYCEFAALKKNLWYSVYNQNPGPEPGDWTSQLRQLVSKRELRPWDEQIERDLRDWDAKDYLHVFGMVGFLLNSAPQKFLAYVRTLRTKADSLAILEDSFGLPAANLQTECNRWLLTGN
jgi:hypothetical protein